MFPGRSSWISVLVFSMEVYSLVTDNMPILRRIIIEKDVRPYNCDSETLAHLRRIYDNVQKGRSALDMVYPTHVEIQAAGEDQLKAWHRGLPQPLNPDERRIMAAIQRKLGIPTPSDETPLDRGEQEATDDEGNPVREVPKFGDSQLDNE